MITRGAKRKSLSDAVFLTTELLENVLEFLPMRDLLISQRVARKWRAVISDSTKLQQALFMVPRGATSGWRVVREGPEYPGYMNLNARIERLSSPRELNATDEEIVAAVKHGELNPMFYVEDLDFRSLWEALGSSGDVIFEFRQELRKPRSLRKWTSRPEASWRRMLVTQSR